MQFPHNHPNPDTYSSNVSSYSSGISNDSCTPNESDCRSIIPSKRMEKLTAKIIDDCIARGIIFKKNADGSRSSASFPKEELDKREAFFILYFRSNPQLRLFKK